MKRRAIAGQMTLIAVVAAVAAACATLGTRPESNILTSESRNGVVQGDGGAGGAVYATECAACHGANGEGGFGPELRSSAVADSYPRIVDQVRQGQGAMPAFAGVLTDDEIANVSAYVVQVIARSAANPVLPQQGAAIATVSSVPALGLPSEVDPATGAEAYRQNCSACHGDRGEGSTVGPPLTRPIAYDDVLTLILGGRPGMPAYGTLLPASRAEEVAAYVVATFMEPALRSGSTGPAGVTPGAEG